MTEKIPPAAMRTSDADRDAVLADLSEHFQAGRLTAAELDERTGQALTARTWGELRDLLADLPATLAAAGGRPPTPAGRVARPPVAALAGFGIAVAVLLGVVTGGWGVLWLILPVLLIARRLTGCRGCLPIGSYSVDWLQVEADVFVRGRCDAGGRSFGLRAEPAG